MWDTSGMLYEVKYESAKSSGVRLVLACSGEEALGRFRAEWEEYGGEAPSAWVVGCWEVRQADAAF